MASSMVDLQRIVESVPSEFDYFEPRVIQAAIVKQYDQSIPPITSMQHGAPIEFSIPTGDNLYIDLNNSLLEVKCKIAAADGTNLAADVAVGPINLTLHSLFKSIEFEVGGKQVSDPNTLYSYRAFIETLLTYPKDVCDTRLFAEGWIKDEGIGDALDDFRIVDAGTNGGHKRRIARFALSNTVTLIGRPHLDLFHQEKDFPPNVPMKLRLIPHNRDFVIKKPATVDGNYQMFILSARFYIRTKEANPSFLLAHEQMLQRKNIVIPYTKNTMKSLTVVRGTTSFETDKLYGGTLPERIVLGLVLDERVTGTLTTNPFRFQNFNMSFITLKVNSEQVPRVPYTPHFPNNDYIREYLGLLAAIGLDNGTKTINLTPEEWAQNYCLFVFCLVPNGLPSVPRTGSVGLEIKFRVAPTANLNLICYAEYNTTLEIDRDRNILI